MWFSPNNLAHFHISCDTNERSVFAEKTLAYGHNVSANLPKAKLNVVRARVQIVNVLWLHLYGIISLLELQVALPNPTALYFS